MYTILNCLVHLRLTRLGCKRLDFGQGEDVSNAGATRTKLRTFCITIGDL